MPSALSTRIRPGHRAAGDHRGPEEGARRVREAVGRGRGLDA